MDKLEPIKYFMNLAPGLAQDAWALYFDFDTSGSVIIPRTGFQNINSGFLYSGIISPNVGPFWENSGKGKIGNNYININENSGRIDFQDFTLMCILNNQTSGGATIVSTVCTGQRDTYDNFGNQVNEVFYQGFEFGLTANNKLFYEYYDNEGIKVFTSDFYVSDKSSIFLKILYGTVSFGYYDFFKQVFNTSDFYIDTTFILNPKNIFIGKNPISSGLYNYNKQFNGELDQFLIFSPSIYEYEMKNFNSGFVSTYYPASTYVIENYSTGVIGFTTGISGEDVPITGFLPTITGYESGIIGYETGVIDQYWTGTGTYIDDFGNSGELFGYVEITGFVPLTGLLPLTGIDVTIETGFNNEYIIIDTNYIYSFGEKNINLLTEVDKDDLVDIELITGNELLPFEKNINSFYDDVSKTFVFEKIRNDIDEKNYIIFANGQLVNSGSSIITGSIYSNGYLIFEDYIPKFKGEIFFNNKDFGTIDNIFADFVTGTVQFIENFNVFSGVELLNNIPNLNKYNLFINGQKLLNNFHYNITNNQITFIENTDLYTGITGKMLIVPRNFNYSITGSNRNLYKSTLNFYNNYSQVYKNGIRQSINFDYLEVGNFSINTGIPILDKKNNLIYNNQTLFN
jgi:hypothetical protein